MPASPARSSPLGGRLLRTLGPAIVVASVVLGPGSILASSRVGAAFGYSLLWVLVGASLLMAGMVLLSARLGLACSRTLCDELSSRLGRPVAAGIGLVVFLIVTSFQTSNNFGVLAAFEAFSPPGRPPLANVQAISLLMLLNGLALATVFGLRRLYRPIERLMLLLVLAMIAAFVGNIFLAKPDWAAVLRGLLPSVQSLTQTPSAGNAPVALLAVSALVGTTYSVAGAYYQAYLVREKGWTRAQVREGMIDVAAGIAVLGGISLVIMITAAAVFHSRTEPVSLDSAADIARQLQPLFGSGARLLFSLGLFAAAFSSFLMNAIIGGHILADGLGLGPAMESPLTRVFTALILVLSMLIAVVSRSTGLPIVHLILFAQALTVLGLPALAAAMLYLATRPDLRATGLLPPPLLAAGWIGLTVALLMALLTSHTVATQLGWL